MKRWLVQIVRNRKEQWVTVQGQTREIALAALGNYEVLRVLDDPEGV